MSFDSAGTNIGAFLYPLETKHHLCYMKISERNKKICKQILSVGVNKNLLKLLTVANINIIRFYGRESEILFIGAENVIGRLSSNSSRNLVITSRFWVIYNLISSPLPMNKYKGILGFLVVLQDHSMIRKMLINNHRIMTLMLTDLWKYLVLLFTGFYFTFN